MAAPTGTANPTAIVLSPGQSRDVVVTGADADNASGTGTIDLTDGQGNVTPITVSVTKTDPLTFGPGSCDVPGVTVTKLSSTPNSATYRFQA